MLYYEVERMMNMERTMTVHNTCLENAVLTAAFNTFFDRLEADLEEIGYCDGDILNTLKEMQESVPVWRRKPHGKYISNLISLYEWWNNYRKGDFTKFYTYSQEAYRYFFWLLGMMKDYGEFIQALTDDPYAEKEDGGWENFAEENG